MTTFEQEEQVHCANCFREKRIGAYKLERNGHPTIRANLCSECAAVMNGQDGEKITLLEAYNDTIRD